MSIPWLAGLTTEELVACFNIAVSLLQPHVSLWLVARQYTGDRFNELLSLGQAKFVEHLKEENVTFSPTVLFVAVTSADIEGARKRASKRESTTSGKAFFSSTSRARGLGVEEAPATKADSESSRPLEAAPVTAPVDLPRYVVAGRSDPGCRLASVVLHARTNSAWELLSGYEAGLKTGVANAVFKFCTSKKTSANTFPFERIVVEELSAERSGRKFYASAFEYDIFPDSGEVQIEFRNDLGENIDVRLARPPLTMQSFEVLLTGPEQRSDGLPHSRADVLRVARFFLWHHEQTRLPAVDATLFEDAMKQLENELIGIRDVALEVKQAMALFLVQKGNMPRGLIFWGPPGTGKTTVMVLLCRLIGMVMVAEALTSGSFRQGIVGESEKMVLELGRRAKVVPWEACCAIIDEIDGLAPSRGGNNKSEVNLVNVLLGMVGGATDVPNLVLFGATNFLTTMDDAFKRRIEFKIFVGRPSFDDRQGWIDVAKINGALKRIFKLDDATARLRLQPGVESQIVDWTINFSQDAIRKLLVQLAITKGADELLSADEIKAVVRSLTLRENIRLGRFLAADVLSIAAGATQYVPSDFLFSLADIGGKSRPRGQMLVDLVSPFETFQVAMTVEEDTDLVKLIDDLSKLDRNIKTSPLLKMVVAVLSSSPVQGVFAGDVAYLNGMRKAIAHISMFIFEKLGGMQIQIPKAIEALQKETEADVCREMGKLLQAQVLSYSGDPDYDKKMRQLCVMLVSTVMHKMICTKVDLLIERLSCRLGSSIASWKAPQTSLYQALGTMCKLATRWKMRAVQLVDYPSLVEAQKHSEEDQVAHVYALLTEFSQYAESLLAFDLDSLAGMSTEFSGMESAVLESSAFEVAPRGHTTVSFRVQRPRLLEAVLALFRDNHGKRPWVVAISSCNELTRRFKEKLQWRTENDKQAAKEQEASKKRHRCVVCLTMFSEEENHDSACGRHFDVIVHYPDSPDNTAGNSNNDTQLTTYNPYVDVDARKKIREELTTNRRARAENFRWRCCGAPYHQAKGEDLCRHTTQLNFSGANEKN